MELSETYQYDILPHGTSIRLMELFPGTSGQQLACRLLVVDLNDCPSFESISYVCGSEENPEILICNDKPLRITKNLAIALRRFRNVSTTRVLWTDGVCIHQTDILEKNRQIKLMGQIYRSAIQVLIWLGHEDGDGHMQAASNVIKCLSPLANERSTLESLWERDGASTRPIIRDVEDVMEDFGLEMFDWREFGSLVRLWNNSWFSRAWTFQESFLAKERTLHYGEYEIDYGLFGLIYDAVYLLKLLTGDVRLEQKDMTRMGSILFAREILSDRASEGRHTLLNLLQSRRGSECKYASDLIYSLLGAATDHLPIEPDYNKPFHGVFAEASLEILKSGKDLSLLGRSYPVFGPSQLSTWIPDWRRSERGSRIYQDIQQSFFTCTGTTTPQCSLSEDKRQLHIAGYVIDTIQAVESNLDGDLESFVCQFTQLTKGGSYQGDESLSEALVRIRCIDLTPSDSFEGENMRWTEATRARYRKILQESGGRNNAFYRLVNRSYDGAQLIVTAGKRIGMIPASGQVGDVIALLLGGTVPMLLRPHGTEYRLVGECYIDQIMDGQALQSPTLPPLQTLTLN